MLGWNLALDFLTLRTTENDTSRQARGGHSEWDNEAPRWHDLGAAADSGQEGGIY